MRSQRYFLILYAFVLVGASIFQLLYRQGSIILWVNQHHSPALDVFFKYATHLGDGRFCVAVGLLILIRSKKKGIEALVIYAMSGLIAQLLKFIFDTPRPSVYFEGMMQYVHTVSGIELLTAHSFPSGHTASAFALYTWFATWTKNPILQTLWLVPAVVVGYSRMYLFQHFPIDVYVGSMLGVLIVFLFQLKSNQHIQY